MALGGKPPGARKDKTMKLMNKLTCKACGTDFERTGKRGRPRTECYSCTPAGVFPTRRPRTAAAEAEPQGCSHCGNVAGSCTCTGGVGFAAPTAAQ